MSTKITIDRYNAIQTKINAILGKVDTGYGQDVKSVQLQSPIPTNTKIRAVEVNNLITDLRKILKHQDGNLHDNDIKYVVPNETKVYGDASGFGNYEYWIDQAILETRKWNLDTSQSTVSNALQSIRSSSSGWNSEIVHAVTFNFTDAQYAKYFFNAGGSIILSTAMADNNDVKSNAWAALLNSIHSVVINHNSTVCQDGVGTGSTKGFYDLNTNYQDIYTATCAAPYTLNKYTISARRDGQFVYVKATFTDGDTGIAPSNDRLVQGTITSSMKYRIASSNDFTLTAPTMLTSTGLDSSGISQSDVVTLSNPSYEGSNLTVDIKTYPARASVWYKITGPGVGSRFTQISASVPLTNGNKNFTIPIDVDLNTGPSNVTMELWDNDPTQLGANKLATSNEALISDTPIDIQLAILIPSDATLDETNINTGTFTITSTGLSTNTPTSATVTATGDGASHLTLPSGPITIATNGNGTFGVSVNKDYKTTGPLHASIVVSVGTMHSNAVQLTINDTSKPVVAYSSTRNSTGANAYTHDTNLTYAITGGKPNGKFTFKVGDAAESVELSLDGNGTYAPTKFVGLLTPGDLTTTVKFIYPDGNISSDHVMHFDDEVQEITLSSIPPDITSGKTLQIDFSLSHCHAPAVINWELVAPIPAGIYQAGGTLTSGTITTAGNTGNGTGSLILEANAASVVKGTAFTVKFTLSTLTSINVTSSAIRIIDAFPYTTQSATPVNVYLPTAALRTTIEARGGGGGGGGANYSTTTKISAAGGDGGSAFGILCTCNLQANISELEVIVGLGGNPPGSKSPIGYTAPGGIGAYAGGAGGAVGGSSGGGAGGGASKISSGSTTLVIAGGAGGGGGGASSRPGSNGMNTSISSSTIPAIIGTAGQAGSASGGAGGGGGGANGGIGGTSGADNGATAQGGTAGMLSYNATSIVGSSLIRYVDTAGLGERVINGQSSGGDGEVTIYVQPMAPQYPVAQLQVSGTEYKIIADAPLKDGSSAVTGYTATSSVSPTNGISTATNPTVPVTVSGFTPGQRILFKLTADNVFGHGVEVVAPTQTAKLTISDTLYPGVKYGKSCAISGDGNYLVVGAPLEDFSNGAANIWIYKRSGNTWTAAGQLLPNPLAAAGDQIGYSVDINYAGDRIVVGAPYSNGGPTVNQDNAGGVYIFKRTGESWDQEFYISGGAGGPDDYFGNSVGINSDGTTIIIGAYGDDGTGDTIGFIYTYDRPTGGTTWGSKQIVNISSANNHDEHGWSVAISNDGLIAVEGAHKDQNNGYYDTVPATTVAGMVNLSVRTSKTASWKFKRDFTSPNAIADGRFGTSVALNAACTILVVGAPGESAFGLAKAGTVHIFTGSGTTWNIQAMLVASDAQAGANFGTSVSINDAGDTILVGANNAAAGTRTGSGIVYKFVKSGTTWNQAMVITPYDKAANDSFGTSVSMNSVGDLAVIGAPNTDPTKAGAAYTFQI